jgi:hypothetical protein
MVACSNVFRKYLETRTYNMDVVISTLLTLVVGAWSNADGLIAYRTDQGMRRTVMGGAPSQLRSLSMIKRFVSGSIPIQELYPVSNTEKNRGVIHMLFGIELELSYVVGPDLPGVDLDPRKHASRRSSDNQR